jgi:hypothetical protein
MLILGYRAEDWPTRRGDADIQATGQPRQGDDA